MLAQFVANKISAVAEMGDRAKAKWAEKWGAAMPLSLGGAGSPSNIMLPELRPTFVPSGIQPFGYNTPALQTGQTGRTTVP